MKIKGSILILFAVLLGCSKGNNINVTLNGALSNCPANYVCTYNYYDHAEVSQNKLTTGGSRVFSYTSVDSSGCIDTKQLYFKTSLGNSDFDLKASQVAAGLAIYYESRSICMPAIEATKPIGGEIKGKKTDADHWLINATVILGDINNKPVDTLTVNQSFTLQASPK
ncbi:MAG TPA: hypothetical protein VIJ27_12015 [Mucilaginibacter sp.]